MHSSFSELEPSREDLIEFIKEEQERTWTRLDLAIQNAMNGVWSITAKIELKSLVANIKVVGVIPWEVVPKSMLVSGIYNDILEHLGLPRVSFPALNYGQWHQTYILHGLQNWFDICRAVQTALKEIDEE